MMAYSPIVEGSVLNKINITYSRFVYMRKLHNKKFFLIVESFYIDRYRKFYCQDSKKYIFFFFWGGGVKITEP